MDLYRIKPKLTKVAGRRISPNPQQWGADIIKSMRQDHPYADLAGASVEFRDADPDSGTAYGTIALSPNASVIFSIRPDTVQRKPELDPLDILVEKGRYRSLTEPAYREAMTASAPGAATQPQNEQQRYSPPPQSNPYVGDMTGDVSPLEAGNLGLSNVARVGTSRTASSGGLTPGLVVQRDTLGRLLNTLANYPHLSRAADAYGLKQSIVLAGANLLTGPEEHAPDAVLITKGPGLSFIVKFPNGESRACSRIDLEGMFMSATPQVMRQVMRHGMATVRAIAELGSVDLDSLSIQSPALIEAGTYNLDDGCGCGTRRMEVVKTVLDVDGRVIDDKMWHAFDPVTGAYLAPQAVLRGMKTQPCYDGIVTDERKAAPGLTRFWFKELRALSPIIKVEKMIEVPGKDAIFIAQNVASKMRFGWRFVESLARPVPMPPSEARNYGLDVPLYLMPVTAEMIPVMPSPDILESTSALKVAQQEREAVELRRISAHEWSVQGQSRNATDDLILKLACRGVPEARLLELWAAPAGHTDKLWLPRVAEPEAVKVASKRRYSVEVHRTIGELQKSAQEVAAGVDQAMGQGAPAVDPRTLDSVLALQLVSDENLLEILQAEPLFAEAEDKIARLVLAARLGKDTLDEDGLTRALRGMGSVHKALQILRVEQEQMGYA